MSYMSENEDASKHALYHFSAPKTPQFSVPTTDVSSVGICKQVFKVYQVERIKFIVSAYRSI